MSITELSKSELVLLKKLLKGEGIKPSGRTVRAMLRIYGDQTLEEFQRRSRDRECVGSERKRRSKMKMQND